MLKKTAAPKEQPRINKISIIRFIYLYLITAITFIVFIIGAVTIVNTALKVYVFHVDEYYTGSPMMYCEKMIYTKEGTTMDNPNYQDCIAQQTKAEEERKSKPLSDDAARNLSIGIAQVLIAFPLWIFHWRIIERDRKEKKSVA